MFHSVVSKILFNMRRERPDLETAISFSCRRVTKIDLNDHKKLKIVLTWVK